MYSKEYLVNVFVNRFIVGGLDLDKVLAMEKMANEFYDKVGREEFRRYATITPEAIREYERSL